jgi:cell division septation protein DedD
MSRTIGLLATLAILALVPSRADAQRHGRGTVNTPYGQFSMQEMQAAGGNPLAAGQMREQRMMMLNQQQMAKQNQLAQQQMAKQQKARQDYLKKHPEEAAKLSAAAASATARPQTKSRSSSASAKAAGSASASKVPGDPDASNGFK